MDIFFPPQWLDVIVNQHLVALKLVQLFCQRLLGFFPPLKKKKLVYSLLT